MNYKKAFKCSKCPQSNGEDGCPMWWEIVLKNDVGETKILKQCGYQTLPELIVEGIKSADHSAAASYEARNQVMDAVQFLQHDSHTKQLKDLKQADVLYIDSSKG